MSVTVIEAHCLTSEPVSRTNLLESRGLQIKKKMAGSVREDCSAGLNIVHIDIGLL